ncbi:aldose 1-epimerase family protein [Dermabacter sp. HSID17554]|uniref:aldose 1-epimerase family protein n=1 Tax=Dermabacter sp. HSID17554 TaxID=2419511 RepID=UPI000F87983A|nr:aldose 1-epimerase family protein [Dermabacter sp. HSID17554]RUP85960.1 galactose mutarotase [Dermabacter sp. HSID17554]
MSTSHSLFRGEIITLTNGASSAELTSVGAALNRFCIGGRDFVVPGAVDDVQFGYRGGIIAPWPNRIGNGTYTYDGVEYELPLNEHERRNALHGLVSWSDFSVENRTENTVDFFHHLIPVSGYPFPLSIRVRYTLHESAITTEVTATNLGETRAPYGVCPHPYVVPGAEHMNEWETLVPASHVLEVDERLLPVALSPVENHPELHLDGSPIGDRFIDHAYTGFSEGRITVRSASGEVWVEFDPEALPWAQIHTADHPDPSKNRAGLAVEPMTCPPDAFRTGENLVHLAPGASHTVSWTIGGKALS